MKWFVHVDQSYYPSAHIVEANTANEAKEIAWGLNGGPGYPIAEDEVSFVVTPLKGCVMFGDQERLENLEGLGATGPGPELKPKGWQPKRTIGMPTHSIIRIDDVK